MKIGTHKQLWSVIIIVKILLLDVKLGHVYKLTKSSKILITGMVGQGQLDIMEHWQGNFLIIIIILFSESDRLCN